MKGLCPEDNHHELLSGLYRFVGGHDRRRVGFSSRGADSNAGIRRPRRGRRREAFAALRGVLCALARDAARGAPGFRAQMGAPLPARCTAGLAEAACDFDGGRSAAAGVDAGPRSGCDDQRHAENAAGDQRRRRQMLARRGAPQRKHRASSVRSKNAPPFRLMAVSASGDLTLQDVTLSGGDGIGRLRGGAITNYGNVTIVSSTISGNVAFEGGAVFNEHGHLNVTDSNITNNVANYGGGITDYSGTFTMTNSTLSKNKALPYNGNPSFGGGLLSTTAHDTITGCVISGN